MATHSSVLAWRIPGMREPGGLPSMGLHRIRSNWSDLAAAWGEAFFVCSLSEEFMVCISEIQLNHTEPKIYTESFLFKGGTIDFVAICLLTLTLVITVKVAQSCSTPRTSMDYSPPGFSVHGIFQARILEFSRGFFTSWASREVSCTNLCIILSINL